MPPFPDKGIDFFLFSALSNLVGMHQGRGVQLHRGKYFDLVNFISHWSRPSLLRGSSVRHFKMVLARCVVSLPNYCSRDCLRLLFEISLFETAFEIWQLLVGDIFLSLDVWRARFWRSADPLQSLALTCACKSHCWLAKTMVWHDSVHEFN